MENQQSTEAMMQRFQKIQADLPGDWLVAEREAAITNFSHTGFPTPKKENWKYTNLYRLSRSNFQPLNIAVSGADANLALTQAGVDGSHRLIFVNGGFSRKLSTVGAMPKGIFLSSLAVALDNHKSDLDGVITTIANIKESPLVALNTAFMRDGLVLLIPEGIALDKPLNIMHIVDESGRGTAFQPRVLVVLGARSSATILETFVGVEGIPYWTNSVLEIRVGKEASVEHVKYQGESLCAYNTAFSRVLLERGSNYSYVSLAKGGELARDEVKVVLNGEGSNCALSGAALLKHRQQVDFTTEIIHEAPFASSCQTFRNVLDDQSHSVFQGKVSVQRDAQKTDASQSSKNLLLSRGAKADTKPELRISADDVKCAHGATVGDLDPNALFYLTSRGIPPYQAKILLVNAFIKEVVFAVQDQRIRAYLDLFVSEWMRETFCEDIKNC
tara:strand:- start:3087 stop:4418 length:1332 start_codon:yes stop_codon:yes gene_type:complete